VLVGIITATFAAINSIHPMGEGVFAGVVIIVGVFCIPYTLIFLYSLIARRAHDLDLSDKWVRNVYISYWDPKLNTSRLITEPGSPKKNGYGPPMESRNYFVIVGLRRPRKD
jgi:uncharacterized membrane protein YhaH (DUF805 family)